MACHVKGKLAKQIKERMGIAGPRKARKQRGAKRVPLPVTEARSWKFTIPAFLPPSGNRLLQMHWGKRTRYKQACYDLVAYYGRDIPKAKSKRMVLITMVRFGQRKKLDTDNARKIVGDGLVKCGLLMDDGPDFATFAEPVQVRGEGCSTTIQLLEVPE